MATVRQIPRIRHPRFDVAGRPFLVIWETTRACDLACAHCRAEANPQRDPAELTTAEARSLLDEIAAFGAPHPLVVLTGGDPMKREDLPELISHAASRNLPVAFSPSATPLLTPEAIAKMKSAGLKALSLSVDAASPAIHDAFRGIEGVFDRTMEAWEAARAAGLKIQINTTVARRNLLELPAVARLVRDRSTLVWSVFFLVPVGRGATLEQITPEQCEDVMHFLYDVGQGMPVKTTEGHHFKRIVVERAALTARHVAPASVLQFGPTYHALHEALGPWPTALHERRSPMDINSGRGFVFISHTGTVFPSGFLPFPAGNVRDLSLAEIYRDSAVFRDLRNPERLGGRCGRCEFASICGGSRSRAYAATGDPLAEDPLCSYTPGSFLFPNEAANLMHAGRR